ncbi:uncharacterized protein [Porites lutea]|uniref:uncharacterized protein isoform X2 n=1 Tax=Porites lutea TaxID=51062 RepID=UPI003CC6012B
MSAIVSTSALATSSPGFSPSVSSSFISFGTLFNLPTVAIFPSSSLHLSSSSVGVNHCLSNPCDENAVCENTAESYICVCKNGFTGNGQSCQEINECDSSPCREDQVCEDLVDSYQCRCRPGEFEKENGGFCQPADAFEGQVRVINKNYTASLSDNTSPEYQLLANETCSEVDKVYRTSDLAPVYLGCEVVGFRNGSVIVDFVVHFNTTGNATLLTKADDVLKQSVNQSNNGSSFAGLDVDPNQAFLVDRDECQNSANNDCDQNAICNNTIGSFECFCKKGFTGNGKTCSDIDECKNSSLYNCNLTAPGVTCQNTPGGFQCACRAGYAGNGVTCNVTNHCLAGTHNCHPNATCTSFPGPTFKCACNEERRYYGNGTHCFVGCPVNHCENGGTCIISEVGNICKCPIGFYGDQCEIGSEPTSVARAEGLETWFIVAVALASALGALLLFLCIFCICICRRRRRKRNKNALPPITPRRYRPARKSGVVHLETIDEDFTVPQRRLRATPPTTDSFREVSRGLGVASRAMYQLSRVGQGSQLEQARRARYNMEPSLEYLEFDDWMESIKTWENLETSSDS